MHRVVPELIIENYRAGRFSGEFPAVGMFLDLTGFSSMADSLMQQGQHGAEVLANLMHGVFNPLVENIFNYGGKIVSFAGDGIMALFPIENNEKNTALRALASAWTVQRRLTENPVRQTVYGKYTFSVKIGVTVGSVSWGILRSADGKNATYYFRGTAVDNSARAEHSAKPGEILLTENIKALLQNEITTSPFASFHRVSGFVAELPDPAPSAFPPADLEISKLFVPEEIITQNIRGEFRQIVNLFMSFPDLSDDQLQEYVQIVFELREKYGGLVTRLDFGDKGCNMLVLWGAPVAYENDIGRALNFVLDLKSRVAFPITAGITYYVAHAGYLGSAMCEDYTCYGWGVNLASRFMISAFKGEIWVDERIARRVKNRFEFEYQGAQYFKGFAAAQKVFSFSGRKSQELFHQGEFVGRELELPRLIDCVQPLWQGKFAGLTVLWGDAGIGKSRLVYELKASHLYEHKNVLWALCHTDQILRHSFNPFRYWLFRYFGIDSTLDDAAQKLVFESKLSALIESVADPDLAGELDRVRTALGALLDIYWSDSFYETLDAEGRYNITLAALIALIKAESLRQPVLIFIEDAQFMDDDSKAFLPRLKRALTVGSSEYPVALLISSRHVGSESFLTSDLIDHAIELGALSTQALFSLAEIYLGGAVSPDLVKVLQARSEGNPYFAEQILLYLQEEKLLEMSDKGWKVIRSLQEASLPADIRALLVARLDQLTRNVKEVIQTAAVLGREFEVQVLSEMLQDDHQLSEEIIAAERADIWSALSQIRYMFTHGLLRDAAYAMQMRARRMELHAVAVDALEKVYAEDVEHHYGELAYHAESAKLADKALHYLQLAGKVAADAYQNSQAMDYLTRALVFVPVDDLATHSDLVTERVELFSRMGQRELQLSDLHLLERWAEQIDDPNRLAKAMSLWSLYYYTTGHYLNAIEYAKRADTYFNTETVPELVIKTQNYWVSALLRIGKPDEAMSLAYTALQLARSSDRRVDEARVLTLMGLVALEQKNPGLAHAYLEDSVHIAREMKERRLEAVALNNLAVSEGSIKGNYALAGEYYEQVYMIAKETGDRYQEGIALGNLGFVAGMQGNISAAYLHHESSLFVAREIGNVNLETYTLINLSAVSGIQKEASQALKFAKQAEELSRKIHDRSAEAWSLLYIGHACLLMENYVDARKAYQKSINIRNELSQPNLAMEALAGLAEAAYQMNDLQSAAQEVEKILVYFESGGSLDGTEEPLRIYYACYQYLDKQKDPRAQQVLHIAKQLLETQVSKLKDEAARQLFTENFPWRHALHQAVSP
ncbi:MAG: adenylate/guanylate cyclase domain-containing protein [Chloroflexota bacterium]